MAPAGSFTQVAAGRDHSCGLRSDGSVVCWGYNNHGQATPPSGSFTQVAAGRDHSCGVRSDGSVVCWGADYDGQATPPSGSFTQIAAGSSHSCGVRSDGWVVCWGYNLNRQARPPSGSFTQIAAGGQQSCGIRPSGSVDCWGSGRHHLPADWYRLPADYWVDRPIRLTSPPSQTISYTLDHLRKVRSLGICWIAVNGHVYDVAQVDKGYNYPGPGSIMDFCGEDLSDYFDFHDIPPPPEEFIRGVLRYE